MIFLLFLASLAVIYYIIPPIEKAESPDAALPEGVAGAVLATEGATPTDSLLALGRALEGRGRGLTPSGETSVLPSTEGELVRNLTNRE